MKLTPFVPILVFLVQASGCATTRAPETLNAPSEPPPAEEPTPVAPPFRSASLIESVAPRRTAPVAPRVRADALRAPGRTLETTRLPGLHLEDEPSLREAMRFIEAAAGIDVHVAREAEEAMQDAGILLNIQIDRPISVRSALNLVCELAGDDVAWTRRHGIVLVTTPDKARGEPVTMVFDISDLTNGIPSFAAREMNILPSGGIARDEEPRELEAIPLMQEQMILDLILSTIAPGTWGRDGNSLSVRNGRLFVRHD